MNAPTADCPNLGDPNQPATYAMQWNAPGPNGETSAYIFCYTIATVQTGFYGWFSGDSGCADLLDEMDQDPDPLFTQPPAGLGGYMEETCDTSAEITGLQSIVLPNGTYWAFLYDVGGPYSYQGQTLYTESYGGIKEIQLPTGGKIDYQYRNISQCSGCYGDPSVIRVVASRTTTDALGNQSPRTFTYAPGYGSSPLTTETDAAGNDIVHTFGGAGNCGSQFEETKTQYYQGSAAANLLLKELDTTWTANNAGCPGSWYGGANPLPGSVTTRTPAGIASVNQKQYPVEFTGASYICSGIDTETCGPDIQPQTYPGTTIPLGEQVTTLTQAQQESIYDGSNDLLQTTVSIQEFTQKAAYANTNQLTLLASQQILDAQGDQASLTTYGYDENNGSPGGTLGNQTSVSRWLNTSTSPVVTSTVYNAQVMPTQVTDGNGNITNINLYQCGGLYPASITVAYNTPMAETSSQQIDCNSGYIQSSTDANGVVTDYEYDDLLGRLTKIRSAVGSPQESWTVYSYPSMVQTNITRDEHSKGDGVIASGITTDGLGRTVQQQNPDGSAVVTTYNGVGSVQSVTNPFMTPGDKTYGLTSYTYDALGRIATQIQPDGSRLQWCYDGLATNGQTNCRGNVSSFSNGEWVDEADEAGNDRQLVSDAQGRLRRVIEPGAMETQYGYDGLGNLSQVYQKGASTATPLSRAFSYDSLSRLVTSNNPETGTTCYGQWSGGSPGAGVCQGGYDANGNLLYRTDANGQTVHYGYDGLNRLTSKTSTTDLYTNAALTYDQGTNGIGRLTQEWNTALGANVPQAGTQFTYDATGRVASATPYYYGSGTWGPGMGVLYDLAGNITQLTYPDGRVVTQTWDGAGRLQSIADATPNGRRTPYLNSPQNGVQYWPSGAVMNSAYGDGVTPSFSLNDRLQPCRSMASIPMLAAGQNGGGNLLDRSLYYSVNSPGNCGNEPRNKGNIRSIVDNLQPVLTQGFQYDSLNRLTQAARSDGAYNHTYNYDSFGNMILQDNLHGNPPWSIDPATNRLLNGSSLTYYPNGDLASSPGYSYIYTAEGYLRGIGPPGGDPYSIGSYLYNSLGERTLAVQNNVTWSEYAYLNGQLMAELDNNGGWTDYIYAGGQKIAKVGTQAPLWHMHFDRTNPPNPSWGVEGPVSGVATNFATMPPIAAGDKLVLDIEQIGVPTYGGATLIFTDGTGAGDLLDEATGTPFYSNNVADGQWHHMVGALDEYAGKSVAYILAGLHNGMALAVNDTWVANMEIVKSNGAVYPIFSGPQSLSVGWSNTAATNAQSSDTETVAADPAIAAHYYLADQLGTTQMELSSYGAPVWTGAFTPFGQEIIGGTTQTQMIQPETPDGANMRFKFTGKERDPESGLDNFGARYYGSTMGRFMSPDPSGLAYADPTNPQSLNLYAYAWNNPLINIDPSGMECVWDDGSYDAADDPDTGNAAGCNAQGGTYIDPANFENSLLTNGQMSNIQYGSWSSAGSSVMQSSWLTPSGTGYGGQWAAGQEVDEALLW